MVVSCIPDLYKFVVKVTPAFFIAQEEVVSTYCKVTLNIVDLSLYIDISGSISKLLKKSY